MSAAEHREDRTLPAFANLAAVAAVEKIGLDRFAPEMSTYELLSSIAECHSERRALWHLSCGDTTAIQSQTTYANLLSRITAAANLFHELGARRGDVIGYLLPSLPEVHELVWGGEAAAIACCINYLLEPDLIAAMLVKSGARLLVVPGAEQDPEIWEKTDRVQRLLPRRCEIVRVGGAANDEGIDYRREMRLMRSGQLGMAAPRANDVAAFFHTGGTTGAPRFAPQTHRSQVIAAKVAAYAFGLGPSDVVLNGLPHFHIGGLYAGGLVPLAAGATVVQLGTRGFRDPTITANVWRLSESTRATVLIAVPTVLSGLLESLVPDSPSRALRFVISGASGLSPGLRAAFESRTGVRINEAYGLTEATFVVSVNPWAGEARPGSVGIRLPFVEVEARPAEANPEIQELVVRGPTVFRGYLNANAQPFRDDWLVTGDIGHVDGDGHIYVTGRSKDLIKRGGHTIDPLLIEEVLAVHPGVALCAAVGQPEPRLGEVPVAYVKRRANTSVAEAELLEFARGRVPERAAIPRAIRVRDDLPRTAVGKIDKVELRRDATRIALLDALSDLPLHHPDARIDIAFRGDSTLLCIHSSASAAVALARERLAGFAIPLEITHATADAPDERTAAVRIP